MAMNIESVREKHNSLVEQRAESEGSSLAPSRIAGQFFCEKKVDLTREHGDIETPAKTRGSETHEKAAEDAEEVTDDEFWNALERGDRQIIVESPFVGEAADFLIGGIPDAVLFEDQKPQLIFERKTTSRPDYLYKNQRVQAWLYGFILDSLGFDTEELRIAILCHTQSLDPETGKRLQQLVIDSSEGWDLGEHELIESPKAILRLSEFSSVEYLEDLNWALGYWRNEREPIPTEKAAKCRACEYNDVCSEANV
jgi:CRISPR/Cas system-associated exonuclease Cas4 (RecB family)